MKAVIVDIKGKYAAALDEGGVVTRIPNVSYTLGQSIELHAVQHSATRAIWKRVGALAACAVLLIGAGTGTAYAIPYGTVSLDESSSSIEYTINCFDYVLSVTAADEQSVSLLSELDTDSLRHHRIDNAISDTVRQIESILAERETEPRLAISAETKNSSHSQKLQQRLEQTLLQSDPAESILSAPPDGSASDPDTDVPVSRPSQEHGRESTDFPGDPPEAGTETMPDDLPADFPEQPADRPSALADSAERDDFTASLLPVAPDENGSRDDDAPAMPLFFEESESDGQPRTDNADISQSEQFLLPSSFREGSGQFVPPVSADSAPAFPGNDIAPAAGPVNPPPQP